MSIDWFRSWHGAPTDSKWLLIARRSGVAAGIVSAVVWALFDHASQATPRGSVESFDVETYAVFSGFTEENITSIIDAMKEKNLIIAGTLAAWEKRQPKREDHSTERVHKHRNAVKRSETQRNAREEKSRIDKDKKDTLPSVALRAGEGAAISKRAKKQAIALPASWKPSLKSYEIAEQFGQNVQIVEGIFRDYVASSGKLYADHDAAFHNFIRNQNSFNRGANNGIRQPENRGSIVNAADRAIANLEREIAADHEAREGVVLSLPAQRLR